jgi:hypothetical protein
MTTEGRRAWMREYMRRRRNASEAHRWPQNRREVYRPSRDRGRVNNALRWADNRYVWEHGDGKLRNYPARLDSGNVVQLSFGTIRTAR